jgi:hypothetical protein
MLNSKEFWIERPLSDQDDILTFVWGGWGKQISRPSFEPRISQIQIRIITAKSNISVASVTTGPSSSLYFHYVSWESVVVRVTGTVWKSEETGSWGLFPRDRGKVVILTTEPHLVPSSRMSGTTSIPPYTFLACTVTTSSWYCWCKQTILGFISFM